MGVNKKKMQSPDKIEKQFIEAVYNLDLSTVTDFFEKRPDFFSCEKIFERKGKFHVDLVSLVCAAENNKQVPKEIDHFDTAKTIMGFLVQKNGAAAVLKKAKDPYYTQNCINAGLVVTVKVPVNVSDNMKQYFTILDQRQKAIEKRTSDFNCMVEQLVDPKDPGSQQAADDIRSAIKKVATRASKFGDQSL